MRWREGHEVGLVGPTRAAGSGVQTRPQRSCCRSTMFSCARLVHRVFPASRIAPYDSAMAFCVSSCPKPQPTTKNAPAAAAESARGIIR
jgi:hypothetical protein